MKEEAMFTEQVLKSILSLNGFSSPAKNGRPALTGVHISVDAVRKTIVATATDSYAAIRMVIDAPEIPGASWERNLSIATLKAALATVKAGGSVTVFPEAYMPEFPINMGSIIDSFVGAQDVDEPAGLNVKYLGALSKVDLGKYTSGRWIIRTVLNGKTPALVATATTGIYEVSAVIMSKGE